MNQTETAATAPQLLTIRQAAERLAVSLRTLERLAASGELSAVRFGRSVRIDPEDLVAFVESRKQSLTSVDDEAKLLRRKDR